MTIESTCWQIKNERIKKISYIKDSQYKSYFYSAISSKDFLIRTLKSYKINGLFQKRWINSFEKNLDEEKIFNLYGIIKKNIEKQMIPYKHKYLNEFCLGYVT